MKKFLLAYFSFWALLFVVSRLHAGMATGTELGGAWTVTEVTAASATIFSNGGWVKGVYASTGVTPNTDWWQLMDTVPISANSFANFSSSVKKSPARVFITTQTAVPAYGFLQGDSFMYDPPIRFSTGCFIFRTNPASGEALKNYVIWRP